MLSNFRLWTFSVQILITFLIICAGTFMSKVLNTKTLTEGCYKSMFKSYQQLNNSSNAKLWSLQGYWMCHTKCWKCPQPCSHTPADACTVIKTKHLHIENPTNNNCDWMSFSQICLLFFVLLFALLWPSHDWPKTSKHSKSCTLWVKKLRHFCFYCHFGKFWPILKITSLSEPGTIST